MSLAASAGRRGDLGNLESNSASNSAARARWKYATAFCSSSLYLYAGSVELSSSDRMPFRNPGCGSIVAMSL